ncbi:MAG: hypothetical protein U1E05_27030 [Patescibacteria group bacterium]|nr:hypothetical protein [Patescibacteria group bacterium]
MERWSKARVSFLVLAALLGWLAAVTFARAETVSGARLLTEQGADGEFAGWRSFHESPQPKTGAVWSLGPEGVLHCKGKPLGYLSTEREPIRDSRRGRNGDIDHQRARSEPCDWMRRGGW